MYITYMYIYVYMYICIYINVCISTLTLTPTHIYTHAHITGACEEKSDGGDQPLQATAAGRVGQSAEAPAPVCAWGHAAQHDPCHHLSQYLVHGTGGMLYVYARPLLTYDRPPFDVYYLVICM